MLVRGAALRESTFQLIRFIDKNLYKRDTVNNLQLWYDGRKRSAGAVMPGWEMLYG